MSAAAVGLGVHEVSGEAITALGLTGAAGLGLGTWFNNEPYKTIYIAGARALGCAVEAVAVRIQSSNCLPLTACAPA